jgi:nucleoside 2-deoxyribosyltransferase
VVDRDVFLAAAIWQPGCHARNQQLVQMMEGDGLTVFMPQRETPPSSTAAQIVRQNIDGVRRSRVVLVVADHAGAGVYFELGAAHAMGKPVFIHSSTDVTALGKMVRGIWEMLPQIQRSTSVSELRSNLKRFIERER